VSLKLGEERRSRQASRGEVEVQGAQDNALMEIELEFMADTVKSGGDPRLRGDILTGRSRKRNSGSPGVHVRARRGRG
jgi:hypothetical protein